MIRSKKYRLIGGKNSYVITGVSPNNPCKGYFEVLEQNSNDKYTLYVNQKLYTTDNNLLQNIRYSSVLIHETENTFQIKLPVKSYVELTKLTRRLPSKSSKGTHFLCNIDKTNYQQLKFTPNTSFDYTHRYVTEHLFQYLHGWADDFFIKAEKFVVFPNIQTYPFIKEDIDIYRSLETDAQKYKFLSHIEFYCMPIINDRFVGVRDLMVNYSNADITDVVNLCYKALTTFLQTFFKEDVDPFMYSVHVSRDYEKRYFITKLNIFNNYIGTKYVSFIDNLHWIPHNMLLLKLKTSNFQLIKRFYPDENTDVFCKDNHTYQYIQTQSGGGILDKMLDGTVLNYYYEPDTRIRPYCLHTVLVKTHDSHFYRVSLSLNTMEHLRRASWAHKSDSFNKIKYLINNNPDIITVKSDIFFGYTDGFCNVKIDELHNLKIKPNFMMIETQKDYQSNVNNFYKSTTIDNIQVVIFVYINGSKAEKELMEEVFKEYNCFHKTMLLNPIFSNNFVILNKMDLTIDDMLKKDMYVLWYNPKVKIRPGKELEFRQLLIKICEQLKEKGYKLTRTCQKIKDMINNTTNFYDMFYDTSTFIYNIRHLNYTLRDEINELLKTFSYNKYSLIKDKSHIISTPFKYWVHYPLVNFFNIFHMQIARIPSLEAVNEYILKERFERYEQLDSRIYSWDEIKDTDLYESDIVYRISDPNGFETESITSNKVVESSVNLYKMFNPVLAQHIEDNKNSYIDKYNEILTPYKL